MNNTRAGDQGHEERERTRKTNDKRGESRWMVGVRWVGVLLEARARGLSWGLRGGTVDEMVTDAVWATISKLKSHKAVSSVLHKAACVC